MIISQNTSRRNDMRRKIKFRGKHPHIAEWCFGNLVDYGDGRMEIHGFGVFPDGDNDWHEIEVAPDTVGQFTGMKDSNGTEIYEGDIINWLVGRNGQGFVEEGHVEWRQIEGCYIVINRFSTKDNRENILPLIRCTRDIKVIGNIYDNPELLAVSS